MQPATRTTRSAGPALPADGPPATDELLHRLGHRYAAAVRAAVGILIGLLLPFAGPPIGFWPSAAVSALFIVWSLYYLHRMRRSPRPWVWMTDVTVVCALCLAQRWLVPPDQIPALLGFSPVASVTVVALQWHLRLRAGVLATAAVCAAYVVGASAVPGVEVAAVFGGGGVWMLAEAAMSRGIWELVRRGGRTADRLMAEQFAQERGAALAAGRRAEQRAHWAAVHDTSASTLLMVGLGEVRGDEEWLPAQVRRDIAALDGTVLGVDGDLLAALRATAAQAPVDVELRTDVDDAVTPPEVVAALAGAAGEALRNVHRHAGTGSASVHVCRRGERVVVVVADDGRGFDPGAVPEGKSGLAVSVHERLALAGGRATVESGAGAGTRVRLEWPDG